MIATQPTLTLWKDLIRVGRYRHPSRRAEVNVTPARLDHWSRTFNQMRSNGVKVHIPADHSDSAADNRGFVLRMIRVGDRLMALCQFIGADAIRDAARNQVSIGVAPTFVDGKGTIYRDAIVHVALTPVPVVPGQGAFMPARAARNGRRSATLSGAAPAGVITLAAANPIIRRADMAQSMLPCSEDSLRTLHDTVPGLSDVPDEQKLEHILQYIQSLLADQATLSLKDEPAPLDPAVRQALLDAVKARRDLCVSKGALTPAVADAILKHLLPDPPVIGLSRQDHQASQASLALSILTSLADNRPIQSGERTGAQLRPLPRATPGEVEPSGPPLYEKMAALANGQSIQL